jgi:hypothetical protein
MLRVLLVLCRSTVLVLLLVVVLLLLRLVVSYRVRVSLQRHRLRPGPRRPEHKEVLQDSLRSSVIRQTLARRRGQQCPADAPEVAECFAVDTTCLRPGFDQPQHT